MAIQKSTIMKKQFLVLIAAITLFACKKNDVRELPGDQKVQLPGDHQLVNPIKDEQARLFRKGGNGHGNGHNPHDTTPQPPPPPPPPPPTTVHKACWLLDFDGYNVSNEFWGTVACSGSDFTAAEIADITARIKSYWSRFDVEITTDEALYNTYSVNKRMRTVFTRTNFWGYVGGVAYIGSLLWTDAEKQCFVFVDLLSRSTKYVADAGAHEMGHTANCWHHKYITYNEFDVCTINSEYLMSHDIMGVSYYDPSPLFNVGEMGCHTATDDIYNINTSIQ